MLHCIIRNKARIPKILIMFLIISLVYVSLYVFQISTIFPEDAKIRSFNEYQEIEFLEQMSAEMMKRKMHGERFCRDIIFQSKLCNHNNIGIIEENAKYVACTHAKAGSTYWKSLGTKIYDTKLTPSEYMKVIQSQMPRYQMNFSEYLFVLAVRHPLTRLTSAYLDKTDSKYYTHVVKEMFVPDREPPQKWVDIPIEGLDLKTKPTFEEFIQYVVAQFKKCNNKRPLDCIMSETIDPHWRPFYIKCSFCLFHHDFIIKAESFQNDFRYFTILILQRLNEEKNKLISKSGNLQNSLQSLDADSLTKNSINDNLENNSWAFETQKDFKARLENLDNVVNIFEQLRDGHPFEIRTNPSKGNTERLSEKFYKVLPENLKEELRNIYRVDFDTLDYDPYIYD